MRKAVILAVAASAFAAIISTAGANHSWNGYHWARTSNPFTLEVGNNVSPEWERYLRGAEADWDTSSVLDLDVVAGGTRPKNCRPTSGRIEACNARYGNNGWLGIAQIWVSGGKHISQAVVKVNDTYFEMSKYNTPAWRQLVMCQEIAHDFGLDHQDENFDNQNLGSCMDYTSDPDGPPSNEHPNSHDYAQLETIYKHTDSTTTVGATTGFLPDAVPSFAPATRVARSTYVDDLGAGRQLVTHVFWAP